MTSTSVGMRCPECASQRTKVHTMRSGGEQPVLTYALLGLLALVFFAEVGTGGSLGSITGSSLYEDAALNGPLVADGDWWRIVTSGFLHGDLTHLLFNGLSLWVLGTLLEPAIGRARFAAIYFASLLAGSLGVMLLEPDAATVGASGAVFGLLGAAIVLSRSRGIDPMANGLMFWLGINLLLSFRPGISLGGHLGGLVGGVVVALLLFQLGERGRLPERAALAGAAVVGLVAGAAALAVA